MATSQTRWVAWTVALAFVTALAPLGYSLLDRHEKRFKAFPRVTFWAWENPEDLRSLGSQQYAVAYLDQTVFISDHVFVRPRMQRLLVLPSAKIVAVVRIEAPAHSAAFGERDLAAKVAEVAVASVRKPQVAALQIDFDAGRSQRPFYRALLEEVRKRMPQNMPLSITALASWCGNDDWIKDLPVDEAVPMFFRMGGFERAPQQPGWTYPIREPLCDNSVGVSTDEPWPKIRKRQRVYVFHSGPWNAVAVQNVKTWTEQ